MTEKIPIKLFYRIGEVARILKVESHTLRYWEQQFTMIRPRKSANGHRVYRRVDVERLEFLRNLLYRDGYTIAGVKKRIKAEGVHFMSPSPSATKVPSQDAADEPNHSVALQAPAAAPQTPAASEASAAPNQAQQLDAVFGQLTALKHQMEEELANLHELNESQQS